MQMKYFIFEKQKSQHRKFFLLKKKRRQKEEKHFSLFQSKASPIFNWHLKVLPSQHSSPGYGPYLGCFGFGFKLD